MSDIRTALGSRFLVGLLVAGGLLCITAGQLQAAEVPAPLAAHQTVVNKYCVFCHNGQLKTAGLELDAINSKDVSENPEVWEKVVRKLRARQMPPVGTPRPDDAVYEEALASLVGPLDSLSETHPNPGRTETFRRLNQTEYRNAIRDLLALDVDVTAMLPSDQSSFGFDNVTVGDLSPTLMDRYVSAAEKISRLAVGRTGRTVGGDTIRLQSDITQEKHFDGLPLGTRGGALIPYTFPVDGDYDISIRLARDRNEHIEGLYDREAHELELMMDRERLEVFTIEPADYRDENSLQYQPSQQNMDEHLKLRVSVTAGPHELGVAFLKKPTALLETARQPYEAHFNYYRHPRVQPAVYSISIIGPYDSKGASNTPSRDQIFVCKPANVGEEDICAERILSTLMRRAYRRPVTDVDLRTPLKLYRKARAEGGFDAGIEMAVSAVLVSPQFLFRIEQSPEGVAPGSVYSISDLELASRMSFFLWSSIPDDELLDVASRGELKKPGVLEQQIQRMLADPRSSNLVTNFASQWLHLRNLASITPDMRIFPDFDDNLRQAFQNETEMFFESIMREDQNVLNLLDADYTFLNERLAKHYEIPNIYGDRFRRIELAEDSNRGGLFRHGSILTVTSYATRTSPVIRGKWILDNILGVPPPPPPANVPELEEKPTSGKVLSMRERLGEHRANPACAGCHTLMDPVGFSLENYDAIGRWRTAEDGIPIDASGELFDGHGFDGVGEFQHVVRPELFVSTMTEKLLIFATGRGVEYYDAPAVRKIVREARSKDFKFSSIIQGIINSKPFQMRNSL